MAFEVALGARWLYRHLPDDYGIDGEVEEFDEQNLATGLQYAVQLKATDAKTSSTALKRSVPHEHAGYYRSLQRPVLMVRYLAASDQLYARWFHQYDRQVDGGGHKSITFRWRDEDLWVQGREDELGEQARAYIRLTSSRAAFPVRVHIDLHTADVDPGALATELQQLARQLTDVAVLAYGRPGPADCRLIIAPNEMRLDLQRVTAATLHFKGVGPQDLPAQTLAHDAFTLLALALERVGQSVMSGRVAEVAFANSSMAADAEVATALASEMARARQIQAAIAVYEALDEHGGEPRKNATAFMVAVTVHAPTLTNHDNGLLASAVERRIDRWRNAEPQSVAVDAFNLANMKRAAGKHTAAMDLLELARELQPIYEHRAQWWTLKGLMLVEQGDPLAGAQLLERALGIADSPLVRLQLAEALMLTGQYARALTAIPDLSDHEPEDPWVAQLIVLGVVLEVIVDRLGIDEQQRDAKVLVDLEGLIERRLSHGQVVTEDELVSALQRDALCFLAWLMLSSEPTTRTAEDALDRQFVLAWLACDDAERWLELIVEVLKRRDPLELVPTLFVCGDEMTDERLLALAASRLETDAEEEQDGKPPDVVARIVAAAEESIMEARDRRNGRIDVRLLETGEIFTLRTSSAQVGLHRPQVVGQRNKAACG